MKRITAFALLGLLTCMTAGATSSRILDGQFITNGANTLTIPAATDTLVGKNTTDTFTNKSLDGGSNTFTNIPSTAFGSAIIGVPNGGTGLATITSKGILFGSGTAAVGVTAAGSQYQSLQAGSGGTPAFDAVHLDQAAAITGIGPVANGFTGVASLTAHNVVIGAGTSPVVFAAPGTAGFALISNGASSDPTFQAIPAMTPALNGGSGSPQSVTAVGGVILSGIVTSNSVWVAGLAGAVIVSATPSVTACTADGQRLTVIGTSNTNTVRLQDQANLAGSGLSMNGDWVGAKDSTIAFHCDITQGLWVEDARR